MSEQQDPDLLRAFFRTRPSILTTVLPRAILSAVESGHAVVAAARKANPNLLPAGDSNATDASSTANTTATTTTLPHPRCVFDTRLQRTGFEISRAVCRFDPLFSDIAVDASKRVKITEAVVRKAHKLITDNANVMRSSSSKDGVLKRIVRANSSNDANINGSHKHHHHHHHHHQHHASSLGAFAVSSSSNFGGVSDDGNMMMTGSPRAAFGTRRGPAAIPAGKKKPSTNIFASQKSSSPKKAAAASAPSKKQPAKKKKSIAAGASGGGPSPPAKRAPRKVVSAAQKETDGVMRAKMMRLGGAVAPSVKPKTPVASSTAAAADSLSAAVAQEQQQQEQDVALVTAQQAQLSAVVALQNSKPPPGMTPFEWRREQKMKMNAERLKRLELGII